MTHNHDEFFSTPVERVATRIVAFAWLVLMIVALAVGCEPQPSFGGGEVAVVKPWDSAFAPNTVWFRVDDAKTTYTFAMNETVIAQANVETGEVRVLVTPTPAPRERIERQVERTETVTLERIDAEIADAERAIARAEEIIVRERARLFRLRAERLTVDAALPSPTPSPTPRPSATPKGGR